ncbi:hypothetical protein O9G_004894 [Rozella allomycis CSF55]|uniref:Uncharacterized protein n=1 Tax=Rozella allomycis (strain CSF55) TaxID=988480 RepID=A0A075AVV4_ROZAC|nr:hypothetical protein O9G_004894 [Rozella allomycis CSF55]|eukprot:EPZ32847.1 hypothetical protein O9G_004894 [Rozella allomycis CSF55]
MSEFFVIAGSYERLLYGLKYEEGNTDLTPSFIMPSHTNMVSCVSAGSRYLASGSTDETIRIYDLKTKKELGSLFQHDNSIRSLAFYENTHLLSASDDGKICLFRTNDWECLKSFKDHSGPVLSLSIHPSGRLALSIGKDKKMCIWNLMNASLAKSIKLQQVFEKVHWNQSGSLYILVSENFFRVFSIEPNTCVFEYKPHTKVYACRFVGERHIVFGGEDSELYLLDIDNEGSMKKLESFPDSRRVKDIDVIYTTSGTYISAVYSSGTVGVWSCPKDSQNFTPSAVYQSKCRLTCVTTSHVFGESK